MTSFTTAKSDGSVQEAADSRNILLTTPSVVTLGIGPEEVAEFRKVGSDLVLILVDGTTVVIANFYVTYEDGRSEVVFVDENDVTWWAQYTEPWARFDIAEIERAAVVAPFPVGGALLGLIGAAAGAGGGSDTAQPVENPLDEKATVVEAGLITGGNSGQDGIAEVTGDIIKSGSTADANGFVIMSVSFGAASVDPGVSIQGTYGVLTLNTDGTYTYVLDNSLSTTQGLVPGQTVSEVFNYTLGTSADDAAIGTFTVVIEGTDDQPLISGQDDGAVIEDIDLTTGGQLEVTDPDAGDTHSWTFVDGPSGAYGTFGLNDTGAWTYVLNNELSEVQALGPSDQLTDTVLVRVTDSYGAFSEAPITVTITGVEDGAVLIDAETSDLTGALTEISDTLAGENTDTLTTFGQIGLTAPGLDASFVPSALNLTDMGTFTLGAPSSDSVAWTFTVPDAVVDSLPAGAVITQSYVVTVTGSNGEAESETVTVTVTGNNDRPDATDDSSTVLAGETVRLNVVTNDTDADQSEAGQLRVTDVAGQPIVPGDAITIPEGTVTLRGNGTLSFTPNAGVTGDVSIPYTVNDNSGTPNADSAANWVITVTTPVVINTATVTISDDTSPDTPGTPDAVLGSIDDLANVPLSGNIPVGSTITTLTVTDDTSTVAVPVESITVNPDGTFSTTADLSTLSDGTLTVDLEVDDNSGRPVRASDTIIKDTVAELAIDPVIVPANGIPTITGTGEPGGTIDVSMDGGAATTVPILSDGTWSFTPASAVPTTEFNVFVDTTDPFGNTANTDRDVVSLAVKDESLGGPETLLFDEASLATGTNPSAGSERISSTLTIGTGDGPITEIRIGGQTILLADLTTSGAVPVGPIATTYGAITVTGYTSATGVITYDYVLSGVTDTHTNAAGIDAETDSLREIVAIAVVDNNGDTRETSLEVAVVDDIPSIAVVPGDPASVQSSDASLGVDPVADFTGLFDIDFGADAAASTNPAVYALGVATPGGPSGLSDAGTGDPIVLTLESGVVVGRVGGTGPDQGEVAFRVLVDAATGVVTLDQQRAIQHPAGAGANVTAITDAAVQLSVTATDGDGDAVVQDANIGARLNFADDLPALTATTNGAFVAPDLITQDGDTSASTDTATADFSGALEEMTNFGADGPAVTDSVVWAYGLSLQGGAMSVSSGLTADGNQITLYLVAGEVVGSTAATSAGITPTNTVFNAFVDMSGEITLSQYAAIDHPDGNDPSEGIRLATNLISLTGSATATDSDGDTDTASTSLAIGNSFGFDDDGPTVGAEVTAPDVTDVDLRTGGATSVVTRTLNIDFGGDTDGTLDVAFQGTQTALEALNLTSRGNTLSYSIAGDLLTASDGVDDVFTVQLQQPAFGNGFQTAYTLTLLEPLDHLASGSPVNDLTLPFAITATDGDGDTAAETFDVRVLDDLAVAVDQTSLSVVEGDPAIGSSSSGENLLNNDTLGADGGRLHQVTYTDDAGLAQTVTITPPATGTGVLNTQYGSLSVNADGTWSYTPDATVSNPGGVAVNDDFSYTLIDGDGDISNVATQPIEVSDTAPTAVDDNAQTAAEGGGALTGNVITNDTPSQDGGTAVGNFSYTAVGGAATTFTFTGGVTTQTVTTPTGSLTVNTDGSWSFTPTAAFDHDAPGSDSSAGSFSYVLVDADGSLSNSADQPLTITDTDPSAGATAFSLSESALRNTGSDGNVAVDPAQTQNLSITKGPDDIANVIFDADTVSGLPNNLTSDGVTLVYAVSADGHTLTATAGVAGPTVLTLVLGNPTDATGATQTITATLFGPLDQSGATQTQLNVAYLVQDTDSAVSGTAVLTIVDDTPLAPANDTPVTVEEGSAAVGSANSGANLLLNDTLGADGGVVHDISYTDTNGDPQTALVPATGAATVNTQYGSLSVQADGTWSFTPTATADHAQPANDTGLRDDFTYRTRDGDGDISGASATQQITVTDTTPVIGTPEDNAVSESNLPNGSNPVPADLTVTGTLDLAPAQDTFSTTLTSMPGGLFSGGDPLEYVFSNGNQSVIAYGGAGRTANDEVFSLDLTNPEAGNAGYTFTLLGTLSHGGGNTLDLDFGVTMTDSDGDTDTDDFTIVVTDDTPASTINQSVDEDGSFEVNTSADATPANTSVSESGTPVTGTPSGNDVIYQLANGTVTIREDGSALYAPSADFSGTKTFEVITDDGGGLTSTTVNATVLPVSDAPTNTVDAATINTLEDTAVPLGLNAPVVTDDGVAPRNNITPERIGAITLTGLPIGSELLSGGGAQLLVSTGTAITIVLTDTPTVTGTTGTLSMTVAEYEALQVLPPEHTSSNFTVTSNVSSFEVDGSGDIISGVAGAAATPVTVDVTVQAVTDDVELTFDESVTTGVTNVSQIVYSGSGGDTIAEVDITEDTTFNVRDILEATFEDLDASEGRAIEITNNTGQSISVDGQTVAPGGSLSFDATGQTGDINSFPNVQIGGVDDFSGELNGISIAIVARDVDADGFFDGSTTLAGPIDGQAEADTTNNSVTLDLNVGPSAGDVTSGNLDVEGQEDTAIAFLQNVAVTDTSDANGSELITEVVFDVPTGWTFTDSSVSNGASWTVATNGAERTITFTGGTRAERDAALDGFTLTPPAHSSLDATVDVDITTEDTNGVTGTDTATVNRTINVVVTPVAELVGNASLIDTDGDGGADLGLTPGFTYTSTNAEDEWFDLNSDGFDLATGWFNQDADEIGAGTDNTFARLTPSVTNETAIGATFRWQENGSPVQQTFNGTPVDIPVSALSSVEFLAPPDVSGRFTISVQAYTEDFDDDVEGTDPPATGVSGMAELSNVDVLPVADAIALTLNALVIGVEDTAIPLSIRPSSSDSSETFTVTINNIPVGATLTYDGTPFTATGGNTSLEITEFDQNLLTTITTPENSNDNFTLSVEAVSVDTAVIGGSSVTSTFSPPVVLSIDVNVQGDADAAPGTSTPQVYSEADLDNNTDAIALSDLVSFAPEDSEGSERLTVRVTDLPEGFKLTDGALVSPPSATGTARVWALDPTQFAAANVEVPDNYSGETIFAADAVTTENDGDSAVGAPLAISFEVTPSPDASVIQSAELVEDVVTTLGFGIVFQNGDTDERIGNVRIPVAEVTTATYDLYLGSGGSEVRLADAGLPVVNDSGTDYYELTAAQAATLSALTGANLDQSIGSFAVLYEIIDDRFGVDVAPSSTTSPFQSTTFVLTASPVTDTPDATITAISGVQGTTVVTEETAADDATPDKAELSAEDVVTVTLNVTSPDDDGSEHVNRVIIDNVPNGVSVIGGEAIGANSWLLTFSGGAAPSIAPGVGTDITVSFDVSDQVFNLAPTLIDMTVQVRDRGNTASPGTATREDTVSWTLETTFGASGPPAEPAEITQWVYNNAGVTEDTPAALSDLINASITPRSTNANTLTVQITDLPTGTAVSGMNLTVIGGVETYTASVTSNSGDDAATVQALLQNLLDNIIITTPENANSNNNAPGGFGFTTSLTTKVLGGNASENSSVSPDVPITPVTDAATIAIVLGASDDDGTLDESDADIPISITLENPADGVSGSIVNNDLYLQITGDNADLNTGTLTNLNGSVTYPLTSVTGVSGIGDADYFIIPNVSFGDQVDVVYTPTDSTLGNLTVKADIVNVEAGSTNLTSTNTETLSVEIGNNGSTETSLATTGDEAPDSEIASLIELNNFTVGLVDNDGSEELVSILLGNVPQGFLVYIGADAASAGPASNAGGDGVVNTWVLSGQGDPLPAFVGILPPKNWSGTVSGLEAIITSGETALSDTRTDIFTVEPITINPVANGVIATSSSTFGDEGTITSFNLNLSLNDPEDATTEAANPDQSQETATLVITGMGAFTSFYIGNTLLTAGVTYDVGTDAYTIAGLSQTDVDTLGFRQAINALSDQNGGEDGIQVAISATTTDGADTSAAETAEVTINLFDQLPEPGDDRLLYTSLELDGVDGNDIVDVRIDENLTGAQVAGTLANIETLNLDIEGANILDGLTTAHVQAMTDDNDMLTLTGTPDDIVNLSGDWFDLGGGVFAADAGGTTVTLTVTGGVQVGAPAGGYQTAVMARMIQTQQSTFGLANIEASDTRSRAPEDEREMPTFEDVMRRGNNSFDGLLVEEEPASPGPTQSQDSMVAAADLFPSRTNFDDDLDRGGAYEV